MTLAPTRGLRPCRGFTLIELIMVMVLIGIIAVVVGPRFFSSDEFRENAFVEELLTVSQYAHQLAVGSGCRTQLTLNATSYALRRDGNCMAVGAPDFTNADSLAPDPAEGDMGVSNTTPSGVTIATAASPLIFLPNGTITDAGGVVLGNVVVTVNGSGSRTFTLSGRTGYVR